MATAAILMKELSPGCDGNGILQNKIGGVGVIAGKK
jgi:hypothetical protein